MGMLDQKTVSTAEVVGGMAMLLFGHKLKGLSLFSHGMYGLEQEYRKNHPDLEPGFEARWQRAGSALLVVARVVLRAQAIGSCLREPLLPVLFRQSLCLLLRRQGGGPDRCIVGRWRTRAQAIVPCTPRQSACARLHATPCCPHRGNGGR